MKYDLVLTGKFKKGLKLAKKRGLNIELLEEVVDKFYIYNSMIMLKC